jgi:serine/threonine-protein kinase RsbW
MYSIGSAGKLENFADRTRGDAPRNGHMLEFQVAGRPEMLSLIRSRVAEFAHSMPFTEDEIDDIKLAVGEAGANSVRHGTAAGSCRLMIRLENHGDSIRIHVIDTGCGFNPESVRPPSDDDLAETGRGIALMEALMNDVMFHVGTCGTHVEMVKRCTPQSRFRG